MEKIKYNEIKRLPDHLLISIPDFGKYEDAPAEQLYVLQTDSDSNKTKLEVVHFLYQDINCDMHITDNLFFIEDKCAIYYNESIDIHNNNFDIDTVIFEDILCIMTHVISAHYFNEFDNFFVDLKTRKRLKPSDVVKKLSNKLYLNLCLSGKESAFKFSRFAEDDEISKNFEGSIIAMDNTNNVKVIFEDLTNPKIYIVYNNKYTVDNWEKDALSIDAIRHAKSIKI